MRIYVIYSQGHDRMVLVLEHTAVAAGLIASKLFNEDPNSFSCAVFDRKPSPIDLPETIEINRLMTEVGDRLSEQGRVGYFDCSSEDWHCTSSYRDYVEITNNFPFVIVKTRAEKIADLL